MTLPDDDREMSKNVGVYILCKDILLRYIIVNLLVVIKTIKDARYMD